MLNLFNLRLWIQANQCYASSQVRWQAQSRLFSLLLIPERTPAPRSGKGAADLAGKAKGKVAEGLETIEDALEEE